MQSAHAPRAARAAAAGASNSVDGTVGKPSARLAFAASKRSFKRLLEGSRGQSVLQVPDLVVSQTSQKQSHSTANRKMIPCSTTGHRVLVATEEP